MYTIEAYVNTPDGRVEKAFTSEHYRGVRWMAARWINKLNRYSNGWRLFTTVRGTIGTYGPQ